MSRSFSYDIFLSYSSKDKLTVRELASRLKADGLQIWFDEWEIKNSHLEEGRVVFEECRLGLLSPSSPTELPLQGWVDEAGKGLKQSRAIVFTVSANTWDSHGMHLEHLMALTLLGKHSMKSRHSYIFVRLDSTELKKQVNIIQHIDWRKKSSDEYTRLMSACRHGTPPALTRLAVMRIILGALLRRRCLKNGWTSDVIASVTGLEVSKISTLLSPDSSSAPVLSFNEMNQLMVVTGIGITEFLEWF